MSETTKQPSSSSNKSDNIDFSVNTEEIASFALSLNDSESEIPTNKKTTTPKGTAKKQTQKNQTQKKQTVSKLSKLPYKIVAVPDGLPCFEYTIQPDKLTCFSGGGNYLSTFYKAQFELNGVRYGSVEEYYQATKIYALCGYEKAAKLQYIREPFKVKQAAKEILRQSRVSTKTVDTWKRSDGLVTLIYATALKFIQNEKLREKLLSTKDTIIVQTHPGDNLFAAGMDQAEFERWAGEHSGQMIKLPYAINEHTVKHFPFIGRGQNLLGVILMKVRQELLVTNAADHHNRDSVNRVLLKLSS